MKKKIMALSTILIGMLLICGCGNTKLKDGSDLAFKVKGKNFSADSLYTEIKKKYGVEVMINMIDKQIFNTIYKNDKDIEKQATTQIDTIKQQYKDNWDETLKNAGYNSETELKEEFILQYQRQKAIEDYVKKNIKIKQYF